MREKEHNMKLNIAWESKNCEHKSCRSHVGSKAPQMESTQVEEDTFAEAETMEVQTPSFEDIVGQPEAEGHEGQETPSALNLRKGKKIKAKMLKEWQAKCNKAEEELKKLEEQRMKLKKESVARCQYAIKGFREAGNHWSSPGTEDDSQWSSSDETERIPEPPKKKVKREPAEPEVQRFAKKHPPPQSWNDEGDEERPRKKARQQDDGTQRQQEEDKCMFQQCQTQVNEETKAQERIHHRVEGAKRVAMNELEELMQCAEDVKFKDEDEIAALCVQAYNKSLQD